MYFLLSMTVCVLGHHLHCLVVSRNHYEKSSSVGRNVDKLANHGSSLMTLYTYWVLF